MQLADRVAQKTYTMLLVSVQSDPTKVRTIILCMLVNGPVRSLVLKEYSSVSLFSTGAARLAGGSGLVLTANGYEEQKCEVDLFVWSIMDTNRYGVASRSH